VDPADAQLIEHIQQVTQGGARLLVTLARRGKALQQDEPQRAAFLVAGIGTHPLYKAGRLAFDMMEIEDLILDGSQLDPMSSQELMLLFRSGIRDLAAILKQMGMPAQDNRTPEPEAANNGGALRARDESDDEASAPAPLPRLSLGPGDDVERNTHSSELPAREGYPELQASDYLYDYVVLGFLNIVAGSDLFQNKLMRAN